LIDILILNCLDMFLPQMLQFNGICKNEKKKNNNHMLISQIWLKDEQIGLLNCTK
jgi:hypothetical protein